MPGSVPKPPGKPPTEPIIIRNPPKPAEEPEIEGPTDGEDEESDVSVPPGIQPEMPPPPVPDERAHNRG